MTQSFRTKLKLFSFIAPQRMFVLQGGIYFLVVRNQTEWNKGQLDLYDLDITKKDVQLKSTKKNMIPKLDDKPFSFSVLPFIGPSVQHSIKHCHH